MHFKSLGGGEGPYSGLQCHIYEGRGTVQTLRVLFKSLSGRMGSYYFGYFGKFEHKSSAQHLLRCPAIGVHPVQQAVTVGWRVTWTWRSIWNFHQIVI